MNSAVYFNGVNYVVDDFFYTGNSFYYDKLLVRNFDGEFTYS